MSTRSLIGLAIIVPVGVIAFFILNASSPERGVKMGSQQAEAACTKAAPDCLPSDYEFLDTMGEVWPAEELKGKVVVVNFWATWCKPCKKEIPAFNRVYDRYKDRGVVMFGILQEDLDNHTLLNFASDHEMTYPIVRLDDGFARRFGVAGNIPTTFIYDQTGKRVHNEVGAMTEQELQGHLDRLLAQP